MLYLLDHFCPTQAFNYGESKRKDCAWAAAGNDVPVNLDHLPRTYGAVKLRLETGITSGTTSGQQTAPPQQGGSCANGSHGTPALHMVDRRFPKAIVQSEIRRSGHPTRDHEHFAVLDAAPAEEVVSHDR